MAEKRCAWFQYELSQNTVLPIISLRQNEWICWKVSSKQNPFSFVNWTFESTLFLIIICRTIFSIHNLFYELDPISRLYKHEVDRRDGHFVFDWHICIKFTFFDPEITWQHFYVFHITNSHIMNIGTNT